MPATNDTDPRYMDDLAWASMLMEKGLSPDTNREEFCKLWERIEAKKKKGEYNKSRVPPKRDSKNSGSKPRLDSPRQTK